jgi:hypothetical protein
VLAMGWGRLHPVCPEPIEECRQKNGLGRFRFRLRGFVVAAASEGGQTVTAALRRIVEIAGDNTIFRFVLPRGEAQNRQVTYLKCGRNVMPVFGSVCLSLLSRLI